MIMPKRVLVQGTGLIGTSVALALRDKGTEVWLSDADPATAKLAADPLMAPLATRCPGRRSHRRH